MWIYTVTVTYTGSNAFVLFMWPKVTRGTGGWRVTATLSTAEVAAIRAAGIAAGFAFSGISRVPVPPSPEVVP